MSQFDHFLDDGYGITAYGVKELTAQMQAIRVLLLATEAVTYGHYETATRQLRLVQQYVDVCIQTLWDKKESKTP